MKRFKFQQKLFLLAFLVAAPLLVVLGWEFLFVRAPRELSHAPEELAAVEIQASLPFGRFIHALDGFGIVGGAAFTVKLAGQTLGAGETAALISQAPDGFEVYSGEDMMTLPLLGSGIVGTVGVATHWTGPDHQQLFDLWGRGDLAGFHVGGQHEAVVRGGELGMALGHGGLGSGGQVIESLRLTGLSLLLGEQRIRQPGQSFGHGLHALVDLDQLVGLVMQRLDLLLGCQWCGCFV